MYVAVLLLSHISHVPEVPTTKVDMIEVNQSICNNVHQVIFWDWHDGRWEVREWRFVEQCAMPVPDGRGWRVTWMDKGRLRSVYARICIASITPKDPEMENRKCLPKKLRRSL